MKDFLRKHGGGRDQVDSLRISEDELAKVCHLVSLPLPLLMGNMKYIFQSSYVRGSI